MGKFICNNCDTLADSDDGCGVVGGDLLISEDDGEHDWHPSLAWSGSEYGLAWMDNRSGNWQALYGLARGMVFKI